MPAHSNSSSCLIIRPSKSAIAVIILKVDPGGYNPFVTRFSKGLVESLTISRHSRKVVLPVKISGEKSGELTKVSICPVAGSVTKAIPLYLDMAFSRVFCKPKSIVVNTSCPGIGLISLISLTLPTSLPNASTCKNDNPFLPRSRFSYCFSNPCQPIKSPTSYCSASLILLSCDRSISLT